VRRRDRQTAEKVADHASPARRISR
jgi:hypothetical protein